LREEAHRLLGQDSTDNRDRRKRRLGGDLGARQHDLVDPGGELLHRCGEDKPADTAPQDRAHPQKGVAAKAGIHLSTAPATAQCVPACAGTQATN
jgi:hypothetical protein